MQIDIRITDGGDDNGRRGKTPLRLVRPEDFDEGVDDLLDAAGKSGAACGKCLHWDADGRDEQGRGPCELAAEDEADDEAEMVAVGEGGAPATVFTHPHFFCAAFEAVPRPGRGKGGKGDEDDDEDDDHVGGGAA